MPFSQTLHHIPLGQIIVDRPNRQRREIEVEDLKASMERRGLLQPIIVRAMGAERFEVIAGERRFTAATQLGWPTIPSLLASDLSPIELQIIELEENFRRKDLSWQDQARAYATIHSLFCSLDEEWNMTETAEHLGVQVSWVSRNLKVAEELNVERIEKSSTLNEALNFLSRQDKRAAAVALDDLLGGSPEEPGVAQPSVINLYDAPVSTPITTLGGMGEHGKLMPHTAPIPPPPPEVLNLSFLDWAPTYQGPKFNLIHCDFPYGVNLFSSEYGQRGTEEESSYEDEKEIYFSLLECFCKNLDGFASTSAHFVFWFSMKHYEPTMRMLRSFAPSIEWSPHPLIWHKSDNAGIIGDSRRDARHVYETALFGRRQGRVIVQSKSDHYSSPTDRALHPSAKPRPMLSHFFEMLVDEHTSLLDPTCGSGTALVAADALGASRVLGLDINPAHCETAARGLSLARKLRHASKIVE